MHEINSIDVSAFDELEQIIVAPYCHADYAWTNTRAWHKSRYIKSFSDALDIMRVNPDFTYGIDNVIHNLIVFMENCPDRVDELKQRVREGRMYIMNGGVSLARPNYVGDEVYIRNMVMGRSLFKELLGAADSQMEMFFNADTAGGHSQMPQLLKLGGHKYYSFQRPDAALDYKKIPKQFIWKGLDGSDVLVYRGYYGGFFMSEFPNWDYATRWDEIKREFFNYDMKYKMELSPSKSALINHGNDDFIPLHNLRDVPIKLVEFIDEWNRREKSTMRFGTPYDYFDILEREEIPVVEGVIDPCDLSFNVPQKGEYSMWRKRQEMNALLPRLETLAALASLYGVEYPADKLKELWLRHFEITGHAIEFILDGDYRDLYSLTLENFHTIKDMFNSIKEKLSRKITTGKNNEYLIVNTQGIKRAETVKLHLTSWDGIGKFTLSDGAGKVYDTQIVEEYSGDKAGGKLNNSIDILAQVEVPPFSCNVLSVDYQKERLWFSGDMKYNVNAGKQPRDCRTDLSFDNGLFTVNIENGIIKSIVKKDGTEIKARDGGLSSLQFIQTPAQPTWIGSWEPINTFDFIPDKYTVVHNGPITWKYVTEGNVGEHRAVITTTVNRGDPTIIFDAKITSTGQEGHFIAGIECDRDTEIHADIPYGVEQRDLYSEYCSPDKEFEWTDSVEQGYTGQFFARTWASFKKDSSPVALISGNCSIYYKFDKKRGRMSLLLNRNHDLSAPEKSDDRFSMWFLQGPEEVNGRGVHNYTYALNIREDREDFRDVIAASRRLQYPLEVQKRFAVSGGTDKYVDRPVVDINCEHIMTTALYKSDACWLLRMYECIGEGASFTITPAFAISKAEKVDFNENPMDDGSVIFADGQIKVTAKPWEIITIKLYE